MYIKTIRNIGPKTLKEIQDYLDSTGIKHRSKEK